MTTIFIVEDDAEVRTALQESIESQTGFAVPVAVGTCREIREALRKGPPDVLLIDLGLPDGCSYGEIARLLCLSGNTVASYTKYIYEKLSVNSRAEAVYEAERLGILIRT